MAKVKVVSLVDAKPMILDHAINVGHEYSINELKVPELVKLGFVKELKEVRQTKELKTKIETK